MIVLQYKRDTFAAQSLSAALELAAPDDDSPVVIYTSEEKDRGAARLDRHKTYRYQLLPGCVMDGAYGQDRVRRGLSGLLGRWQSLGEIDRDPELHRTLLGEMSDDDWETRAALDLLNDALAGHYYFEMEDGGLMLRRDNSDDLDDETE